MTDKGLTLRKAGAEDVPLLRGWEQAPHLRGTGVTHDDWQWETELLVDPPWREQLIAEVAGVPMGFIEIIDPAEEESHYWGEVSAHLRAIDIWIGDPAYLSRGFGTIMMRMAIERCFSDPSVEAIVIDPLAVNESAHRFYRRLGFRFLEERHFGDDCCHVFRLTRRDYRASQDTAP